MYGQRTESSLNFMPVDEAKAIIPQNGPVVGKASSSLATRGGTTE